MSAIEIRRGDDRPVTTTEWLTSRHSFSFGPHYDPTNLMFGLLQVHNDDVLAPHSGYDTHAHREMEIVTWVLDGELTHVDSSGHVQVVRPGQIQRMSAGSGVKHSERNEGDLPARFVQVWVTPDKSDLIPDYCRVDVAALVGSGALVTVASGRADDDAPVSLHQANARLAVAKPSAGESLEVPPAGLVHLYVARGGGAFDGEALREGDAVRLTARGGSFTASTDSELLVWFMFENPA